MHPLKHRSQPLNIENVLLPESNDLETSPFVEFATTGFLQQGAQDAVVSTKCSSQKDQSELFVQSRTSVFQFPVRRNPFDDRTSSKKRLWDLLRNSGLEQISATFSKSQIGPLKIEPLSRCVLFRRLIRFVPLFTQSVFFNPQYICEAKKEEKKTNFKL